MLNSKEADFILRGDGEIIYPEIAKDELELYYDVKGKKNGDVHKDKLLDMSGQGKDGVLSGFDYDGELSGYDGDNGLVFDGVDDTLTTPKLSDINLNNFTYQLNNNILAFTGDEVKTVKNGSVEVGGRNYFVVDNLTPRAPSIDKRRLYTFQVEPDKLHTLKMYGNTVGTSFRVDGEGVRFNIAKNGYQFTSNADGVVTIDFRLNEDLPFIDGGARAKLEKGNKATEWTPAPEDLLETTELKGNILGDMEDIVDASPRDHQSGEEVFTEHADDSHVEVEVDGKSYQHAGSGKNLFIGEALTHYRQSDNVHWKDSVLTYKRNNGDAYAGAAFKLNVEIGVTYNLSFEGVEGTGDIRILDDTESRITSRTFSTGDFSMSFTPTGALVYILFTDPAAVNENKAITNIQIEEGSAATEYEPPAPTPDYPIEIHSLNDFDVVSSVEKLSEGQLQEYDYGVEYENVDKINLSLSEPLRSVGDVKDRLFKDSGGMWKVERNVGYILLDGNQTLTVEHVLENTCRARYQPEVQLIHIPMSDGLVKTSRFKTVHNSGNWRQDRELVEQDHSMVSIRINRGRLNGVTSSDVNNWFRSNHTEVLYTPSTPTIETLDQELQDKLNTLKSFKGSNYIYTVNNTDSPHKEQLKPTLHATFNSKDYLKETRTLTNLLIWARELTDEELIHHNRLFLNRFNLPSDRVVGEPIEQTLNLLHGGMVGHSLEQNYTINI